MIRKGAVLAASISAAIGYGSLAQATWTTGLGATDFVIYEGVAANKKTVKGAADVVYTLGGSEGLAQNDTVTVTLTGGATFSGTAVTLTPNASCDLGAGDAAAAGPISGGAAGDTTATWRVVSATCAAGKTLTLNSNAAAIFDVTGVAAGSNVDIQLTLKTSTGLPIGAANHSVKTETDDKYAFTGKHLTKVSNTTYPTDTVDVASVFKKFTNGTTTGSAIKAQVANQSTASTNSALEADIAAKHLLYTLAGDFNGIQKIMVTAGKVTGDDGTGAGTGTVDEFSINAAKDHAYAVNTAPVGPAGNMTINDTQFVLDGTTAQAARAFTLAIDVLADANWTAHTALPATTAYTINRNGFAFTTTQTGIGSTNVINIRDRSNGLPTGGADINVVVTTYDAATGAGTQTAAFALSKKLQNLGQVQVTTDDIVADAAAAGITIPTGVAANILFTVNTADGTASVKKQVPGVGLDIGSVGSTGKMLK